MFNLYPHVIMSDPDQLSSNSSLAQITIAVH